MQIQEKLQKMAESAQDELCAIVLVERYASLLPDLPVEAERVSIYTSPGIRGDIHISRLPWEQEETLVSRLVEKGWELSTVNEHPDHVDLNGNPNPFRSLWFNHPEVPFSLDVYVSLPLEVYQPAA